jgi:exopolysaccharide production protein ExoZ
VPKILSIQYLRGLAAISVFFFHVSEAEGWGFIIGSAGVDVFFVISGFVMWVTTFDRQVSAATFLLRRAERVVPLYWIATFVTAAIIWLRPQFFGYPDASLVNLVRSLSFVPHIIDDQLAPIIIQGWTLTYEMLFYSIFAFTLFAQPRLRALLSIGSIMLLAAVGLIVTGYFGQLVRPIILEFAAGVAIGVIWTNSKAPSAGLAGLAVMIGLVLLIVQNFVDLDIPRPIEWGIPAVLVVAGSIFYEKAVPILKIPALEFFGNASYSIYIWHAATLAVSAGIFMRLHMPDWLFVTAYMTASFSLTLGAYLVLEKPIIAFFRAENGRRAA